MSFLMKLVPDCVVRNRYLAASHRIGDVLSQIVFGLDAEIGYAEIETWELWESEHARRGYRTLNPRQLICFSGYGHSNEEIIKQKRDFEEDATIYSSKLKETIIRSDKEGLERIILCRRDECKIYK